MRVEYICKWVISIKCDVFFCEITKDGVIILPRAVTEKFTKEIRVGLGPEEWVWCFKMY